MSWHNNPAEMDRFERGVRYAMAIQRGEPVSPRWAMKKLGVSLATAKRDLRDLERLMPVVRERRAVVNFSARRGANWTNYHVVLTLMEPS